MSRDPIFKIVSPEQATGATQSIEFQIAPLAGAPIGGKEAPLRFEFDLEARILPAGVRDAEKLAGRDPKRLAPCEAALKLTGGDGNWTVWVRDSIKDEIVTILVTNDLSPALERAVPGKRGTLRPAEKLSLTVTLEPLQPSDRKIALEINYRYGTQYGRGDSVKYDYDGDLKLWQVPSGQPPPPSMPVVDLYCDAESPTALDLGEMVKLSWVIEHGKTAKLLGPMGGRATVRTLHPDEMAKGQLQLQVLGASIFLLEAEVEHAGERLIVTRSLTLDIVRPEKLAALRPIPAVFLPNGNLSIFWWVSGVYDATLEVGNLVNERLVDEEKPVSTRGEYEVKRTDRIKRDLTIKLTVNTDNGDKAHVTEQVIYLSWEKEAGAIPKEALPSQSHGYHLAYFETGSRQYLLYGTPRGVWSAKIDFEDPFTRTSLEHPCLGLGAGPTGFVVLQKTPSAGQLVSYTPGAKPKTDPVSLPPSLDDYFNRPDAAVHLLVVGRRAYVATYLKVKDDDRVERFTSEAWSLDLEAQDGWRYEPYLAALHEHEPVACGGAIFGFNRDTGQLLRLDLDPKASNGGTLANPRFCAKGATSKDESLLKTGLPIDVEGLLVFVGSQKNRDWVYNPKSDLWNECGSEYPNVRAVAYRGGKSRQMWAVHDLGLYSLSVGAPQLFCPDYRPSRPLATLEHTLFDAAVEYAVTNATGGDLLHLGDTMPQSGYFRTMSRYARFASGEPRLLRKGESAKIRVEYDSTQAEVPEVIWRWRSAEPGLIIRVETTHTNRNEDAWGFRFNYDTLPAKGGTRSYPALVLAYENYGTAISLPKPLKRSRLHLYNGTRHELHILGERTPPTKTYTIDFGVLENVNAFFTKTARQFWLRGESDPFFEGWVRFDMNRPEGIGPGKENAQDQRVALETTLVKDELATPGLMLQLASGQTSVEQNGARIDIVPLAGGTNYFIGFGRIPEITAHSSLRHVGNGLHTVALDYATLRAVRVVAELKSQKVHKIGWNGDTKKTGSRRDPESGKTYDHWESLQLEPQRPPRSGTIVLQCEEPPARVIMTLTPEGISGGTVMRGKPLELTFAYL